MVGLGELTFIKEALGLSSKDLASALNVSPQTVARWEEGKNEPTGLQSEVLQGLHNVAMQVQEQQDEHQAAMIKGLLLLGIGALIFYLLTKK